MTNQESIDKAIADAAREYVAAHRESALVTTIAPDEEYAQFERVSLLLQKLVKAVDAGEAKL